MAPVSIDPTTDPATNRPRVIGYDRDGRTIWASAGGRGLGIEFAVDDKEGDEPDDFDEDDGDEDDGEYEIEDRDDDEGDEDDDEGDDEADEDPRQRRRRDRQQDRWEPPTQSEWEKLQEAQRRNNGELQRNREARKILNRLGVKDASEFADFLIERGIDPDGGSLLDGNADADTDARRQEIAVQHRRAEQRGAEREAARYRPAVVQFAAADAFRDAGFTGSSLNRVLRLLDVDQVDVEFDDHGEVVVYGLDDQVKTIKADLPELFKPRRERRNRDEETADEEPRRHPRLREGRRVAAGARAVDGGDRGRAPRKALGWLEKTDRAMRGLPVEPRRSRRS